MHSFGNSMVTGDQTAGNRHCSTCQCGEHNHNMLQFSGRKSAFIAAISQSQVNPSLVQSRVIPLNDPTANQVGNNVIPNRTVWLRSVSPRPHKITLRISSPDRPNLRPSEYSSSLHKKTFSNYEAETSNGIQVSRIIEPEGTPTTPMKKLVSQSTLDSTMYSPELSERRAAGSLFINQF